jgi:hypothetical protein
MRTFIIVAVIIVLCLFFTTHVKSSTSNFVKSSFDNNYYEVVDPYPTVSGGSSKEDAADTLAKINSFIIKLVEHMKDEYIDSKIRSSDSIKNIDAKIITQRLIDRYMGSEAISEHRPVDLSETSYALNKEYIRFCLRDPSNNDELHNLPILKFVALHELSHFAIPSYDHPEEFWITFKFLLQESNKAGLHIPEDYAKKPQSYCGLTIAYNPFYDDTLIVDH